MYASLHTHLRADLLRRDMGKQARTMMMMSDATAEAGVEEEAAAAPTGELTELARLEVRIGKIVEVRRLRGGGRFLCPLAVSRLGNGSR